MTADRTEPQIRPYDLLVPAFVVVDVDRTDPERAARYSEMSGPSVERHGGRFLARGGALTVLEGHWEPNRLVVIEFASVDAARAWYDSDDYREARTVREGAGTWNMVVVTGI
jgi:uncharacterized protein (DUF1330 family)